MSYVPAMSLEADDDEAGSVGEWSDVEATTELAPLPKQFEAIQFVTREDKDAPIRILAMLGGWGSAKTSGCAQAFLAGCAQNPWTPKYGSNNPKSAILAPTFRILKQSTLVQLDQILPRELVLRRRGLPHNDILLANGHLIELHSGAGELEGASYVNVWIDEISHPTFDSRKYLNYQARARDPHAKTLSVMVSGLPETGWLRDMFDRQDSPSRRTILNATKDNPYIRTEVLAEFLASCPSGEEARLLGGDWMPPVGAVYPQFDSSVHIVDRQPVQGLPVHLSMDVGNFSAVLFSQELSVPIKSVTGQVVKGKPMTFVEGRGKGLLVFDQMMPDNLSVDRICYEIRTKRDYLIKPGVSLICVDPTTDRDELAAIRRHFPGVRIVRRQRGDTTFPVETGIRYVQRALRDALGNVRLFFARGLQGQTRGILESVPRYRYREDSEDPVKDNRSDHSVDSLRYIVAEVLPAEKPKPIVESDR